MANALDIVEAVKRNKSITVAKIAEVIEDFAPKSLQESYDNAGLQVGDPDMPVSAVMLCLDFTEDILDEAIERECNMVISHHPLLFRGLKEITGADPIQRMVIKAIRSGIALYSAHTNLDSATDGVSFEMSRMLGMTNVKVLQPVAPGTETGLGVIGEIKPTPKMEFLRTVKETFNVKGLRYSEFTPKLVIKRVALCGGAGASLIKDAITAGADAIITGDVKYHDFTGYGHKILIADIGHYEIELCARQIFSRIIRDKFSELPIYFSAKEKNPISVL